MMHGATHIKFVSFCFMLIEVVRKPDILVKPVFVNLQQD